MCLRIERFLYNAQIKYSNVRTFARAYRRPGTAVFLLAWRAM